MSPQPNYADMLPAVKKALLAYKAEHGHVAMRKLLEKVGGVTNSTDLARDKYAAVISATKMTPEEVTNNERWNALRVATMHGHARVHGRKASPS